MPRSSPLAALVVALVGTASATPPQSTSPVPESSDQTTTWTVMRIGGDLHAVAEWDGERGFWRAGNSIIDTPLPEGYPAPTPPGAIDLKRYPSVRRAEIQLVNRNSNGGFWPLFQHIKRNEISMTSPVEMDSPASGDSWTMSFLYRTSDLAPVGSDAEDQRITIRDTDDLIVLSLGGRGSYETDRLEQDAKALEQWLAGQKEWEAAGPMRALLYNGPSFQPWRKWLEVQIPVRRAKD